jgi:hypothetical protein
MRGVQLPPHIAPGFRGLTDRFGSRPAGFRHRFARLSASFPLPVRQGRHHGQ